jgi:hypothetical protein
MKRGSAQRVRLVDASAPGDQLFGLSNVAGANCHVEFARENTENAGNCAKTRMQCVTHAFSVAQAGD